MAGKQKGPGRPKNNLTLGEIDEQISLLKEEQEQLITDRTYWDSTTGKFVKEAPIEREKEIRLKLNRLRSIRKNKMVEKTNHKIEKYVGREKEVATMYDNYKNKKEMQEVKEKEFEEKKKRALDELSEMRRKIIAREKKYKLEVKRKEEELLEREKILLQRELLITEREGRLLNFKQ